MEKQKIEKAVILNLYYLTTVTHDMFTLIRRFTRLRLQQKMAMNMNVKRKLDMKSIILTKARTLRYMELLGAYQKGWNEEVPQSGNHRRQEDLANGFL